MEGPPADDVRARRQDAQDADRRVLGRRQLDLLPRDERRIPEVSAGGKWSCYGSL